MRGMIMLISLHVSLLSHIAQLLFSLQLFSSTAAALPAEVGADGKLLQTSQQAFTSPVTHVMLWRKRLAAQRTRRMQNTADVQEEA